MESLTAREGDFVESSDGMIFDVKGFTHPLDRIIAYLRYFPDPSGDRKRNRETYAKVYSLEDRERILRRSFPQYLYYDPVFGEQLEGVPKNLVTNLHKPTSKISELLEKTNLDRVETESVEFVHIIHDKSGVPYGKLGLSGSVLVNLHKEDSDIDLVVYGRNNSRIIHNTLMQSMQSKDVAILPYSPKELENLYSFRSRDTRMAFKDFLRMEKRKVSQGKFGRRDFFTRFILDWDEVTEGYGDRLYGNMGYACIEAEIVNDKESIFTPCKYEVSNVRFLEGNTASPLKEISSFRGRFCEQASEGETVIAQGKLERVTEKNGAEYCRLILGAKPSDFMMTK